MFVCVQLHVCDVCVCGSQRLIFGPSSSYCFPPFSTSFYLFDRFIQVSSCFLSVTSINNMAQGNLGEEMVCLAHGLHIFITEGNRGRNSTQE